MSLHRRMILTSAIAALAFSASLTAATAMPLQNTSAQECHGGPHGEAILICGMKGTVKPGYTDMNHWNKRYPGPKFDPSKRIINKDPLWQKGCQGTVLIKMPVLQAMWIGSTIRETN